LPPPRNLPDWKNLVLFAAPLHPKIWKPFMLISTVESTTVARVAYDQNAQILWLQFRSRALYCYFGVPASIHRDLIEAPSKGTYFNRNIRGRFPYQRQLSVKSLS
jgi:hypothetical protein